MCVCVHAHVSMHARTLSCSVVSDSVTPWTVVCQAPLSMEFSRQGYWRNLPFPTPGDQFPLSCNEPPGKSIRKHACKKKKKKERKHACVHAQSLCHVWYFEIPRTVACQTPLSMEFSRQEYWRGLPFPNPGLEDIHTLKLQVFPNSSPCNIPLGVAYSKLSFLKLPCALIALLAGASQQPFSQLQYPFLWEPEANILSFERKRPKSYWCSEIQYKCPRYTEAIAASSKFPHISSVCLSRHLSHSILYHYYL